MNFETAAGSFPICRMNACEYVFVCPTVIKNKLALVSQASVWLLSLAPAGEKQKTAI